MKNENQLQHTRGIEIQGPYSHELYGWSYDILSEDGLWSTAFGATIEEAEANAKRIVKCCNDEWRIDMHDELVEALKKCKAEFIAQAEEGRYPKRFLTTNGGDGIMFIEKLLKQAE